MVSHLPWWTEEQVSNPVWNILFEHAQPVSRCTSDAGEQIISGLLGYIVQELSSYMGVYMYTRCCLLFHTSMASILASVEELMELLRPVGHRIYTLFGSWWLASEAWIASHMCQNEGLMGIRNNSYMRRAMHLNQLHHLEVWTSIIDSIAAHHLLRMYQIEHFSRTFTRRKRVIYNI